MDASVLGLVGVVVGGVLTGVFALLSQRAQFKHDLRMHELKNQSAEMVKRLVLEMLKHPVYIERSFRAISAAVGGFSDEELRKLLHEVGARKLMREGEGEWWYLVSRQKERVERRRAKERAAAVKVMETEGGRVVWVEGPNGLVYWRDGQGIWGAPMTEKDGMAVPDTEVAMALADVEDLSEQDRADIKHEIDQAEALIE